MKLCSNCGLKPISNSHFKLCIFCNENRLNERKKKPIRKINQTPKNKSASLQKSELKQEIIKERGLLCEGCNNQIGWLTLSHTIPISIRKDLELEKNNCYLECIGCHTIWEHGSLSQKMDLLNYSDKINYIKKTDPELYERAYKEDEE